MTCMHALHTHKYSPAQEYSPCHQKNSNREAFHEARDVFTAPSSALMAP